MATQEPKRGWWGSWQAQAQEGTFSERMIQAKVARLEREVRIFRALFVGVALLFAGAAAWTALRPPQPVPDVLRVRKIEVVNAAGRAAVVLDSDRLGGRIALRFSGMPGDPPPPALFLGTEATGGGLQLFEPGQNFYALSLGLGDGGQGIVQARTRGRQPGVELRGPASPTSGGGVVVFNAAGKPAVTLGSDAAGRGIVTTPGGR